MPRKTLECLLDLPVQVTFIKVNTNETILDQIGDLSQGREKIRWVAQQLHPEFEQEITSWPKTVTIDIAGIGQVLFCHATPESTTELFTVTTPADRLPNHFSNLDADLVVCGHSHMQFDRTFGNTRIVNAGSVESPVGAPGAGWLLLSPEIELLHTAYDLSAASERIRKTGYPLADHFVEKSVLNPPTEDEMLGAYLRNLPE